MLLQFSVENFLSFREPQTLSMLAADGVEHPAHMVMEGPEGKKVLRCAAIYGANASGKSNLVKALEFGTNLVLNGTRAGESIGVRPFKLDPGCKDRPGNFQWELAIAGKHYSYGFELSHSAVISEWLFSTDRDGDSPIFRRENGRIELGEQLGSTQERKLFLRFLADGTRTNQLFLAEARERNATELAVFLQAFEDTRLVFPDSAVANLIRFLQQNADFAAFAGQLLSGAGTGVESLALESAKVDMSKAPPQKAPPAAPAGEFMEPIAHLGEMLRSLSSGIVHLSDGAFWAVLTRHRAQDGRHVDFEVLEESNGTQRLLHLAPALYLFERNPTPIVLAIDELEGSLHPLLTRAFLSRILAAPRDSQLIFTTHDTNLLDLNLLSRDAIWFTEKDAAGATVLYSLAEYKSDQIAALGPQLEKGYLQGRFGAIPFLGDATRLGWKKAAE